MTTIESIIDAYIPLLTREAELKAELETIHAQKKKLAEYGVKEAAELGETTIKNYKGTGRDVKLFYETTYFICGGEYENPALRVEFFNRVAEQMQTPITDKIVFRDNFVIVDDKPYACKDAVLDKRSTTKLLKTLPPEFIEQCIKDGLIGFYVNPRIEVEG